MSDSEKQLKELAAQLADVLPLIKLEEKKAEKAALEVQMSAPGFWNDQETAAKTGKQHEWLNKTIVAWEALQEKVTGLQSLIEDAKQSTDTELEQEIQAAVEEAKKTFRTLEVQALLSGKHDSESAIISFHAGSGGTEAQDWAEMLRRMIIRYAEKKEWKVTIIDESRGGEAGIKSCTLLVEGPYAYGHLQSEHGTHRLVRISPFDAEAMRHTSFANIEVIPEIEKTELVIDPNDLRIDTFCAGGHGGQSVNTTYSAVRIVHVPTGITAQCQNEKSQQQNKVVAMKVLASRLQQKKEEEEEQERLALRGEYKSAEWGNQIRSYVLHPYKMVKDLRSKHESTEPNRVLDGELDVFIEEYLHWKKATTV